MKFKFSANAVVNDSAQNVFNQREEIFRLSAALINAAKPMREISVIDWHVFVHIGAYYIVVRPDPLPNIGYSYEKRLKKVEWSVRVGMYDKVIPILQRLVKSL